MRKTRRNRTPKELRKTGFPLLKRYKENAICKNAIWEQNIYLEPINLGCLNLRANGSSHCAECSENYKNDIPFIKREYVIKQVDTKLSIEPESSELKNE